MEPHLALPNTQARIADLNPNRRTLPLVALDLCDCVNEDVKHKRVTRRCMLFCRSKRDISLARGSIFSRFANTRNNAYLYPYQADQICSETEGLPWHHTGRASASFCPWGLILTLSLQIVVVWLSEMSSGKVVLPCIGLACVAISRAYYRVKPLRRFHQRQLLVVS